MPEKAQGYGTNDQPVSAGGGYGANDTPVGNMPAPAPASFLDRARDIVGRTVATAASDLNPLPLVNAALSPIDSAKSMYAASGDAIKRTRDALKGGQYGEAAKSALGSLPVVGPMAETMARDATEGRIPEALGHATALYAAPKLPGLVAKGLIPAAEAMDEAGTGVTARNRLYDANPGRAIRTETTAFTPGGVAKQLAAKRATLGNQLQTAAGNAPPADLTSPIQTASGLINRAQGANAQQLAKKLTPMRDYFTKAGPGFNGSASPAGAIDPQQSASQLLAMRGQFSPNFDITYGPDAPKAIKSAGRQIYGATSQELKRVVPEAREIDPRLHDIMAAERPAEMTDAKAGFLQNLAHRFGAHTGALAGGLYGYHAGGIPGAIAGLTIPEVLANPTAQITLGRGLNAGAKFAETPLARRGARLVPLTQGLPTQDNQ